MNRSGGQNAVSLIPIVLWVCLNLLGCTNQKSMGSQITVKIPFDKTVERHAYAGQEKTSESGMQSNRRKAYDWSLKKLLKISDTDTTDNVLTGGGSFNVDEPLKVIGTVDSQYTIQFSFKIITDEQQYSYEIGNFMIRQNKSAVKTEVSLEDFLKQYQNQSMLNDNVVEHVNNVLAKIDNEVKGYITSLGNAL